MSLHAGFRIFLVFGILLSLAVTAACDNRAAKEEWLHGTWELDFNPQNDSEDDIKFDRDGSVSIHTADDRTIHGKYMVQDNTVAMFLDKDLQTIEVSFEIAPDRSRLIYRNGAYYTKKD